MSVPPDGPVTLRELYALIGAIRAELVSEIGKVTSHVDQRLMAHENEHREDNRHRSSMIRWAVTTVIAVIGVGAAIVIPLVTKG